MTQSQAWSSPPPGSDGSWSFEYRLKSNGSVFDSGSGMSHHAN
ncbi:MAG: hypothetical protein ABIJ09_07840 [Pseudomonadota bacterium]